MVLQLTERDSNVCCRFSEVNTYRQMVIHPVLRSRGALMSILGVDRALYHTAFCCLSRRNVYFPELWDAPLPLLQRREDRVLREVSHAIDLINKDEGAAEW